MYLVRIGMAAAVTAAVAGAAWAGIPGGDGVTQVEGRPYGQQPVQPEELGLRAARRGRGVFYAAESPRFEIGLPTDWRLFRSPSAAGLGTLRFIAADDVTGRSGRSGVWPDGSPRVATARRSASDPNVKAALAVISVGARLSDRELKELRVFAKVRRMSQADGRLVEIYGYRLSGTVPKEGQNVAVATTTGVDALAGRTDFSIVYYPTGNEDGLTGAEAIARTFRSSVTPAAPVVQPDVEPEVRPAAPQDPEQPAVVDPAPASRSESPAARQPRSSRGRFNPETGRYERTQGAQPVRREPKPRTERPEEKAKPEKVQREKPERVKVEREKPAPEEKAARPGRERKPKAKPEPQGEPKTAPDGDPIPASDPGDQPAGESRAEKRAAKQKERQEQKAREAAEPKPVRPSNDGMTRKGKPINPPGEIIINEGDPIPDPVVLPTPQPEAEAPARGGKRNKKLDAEGQEVDADKPKRAEKPAKAEKAPKAEKPDRSEKPAKEPKAEKPRAERKAKTKPAPADDATTSPDPEDSSGPGSAAQPEVKDEPAVDAAPARAERRNGRERRATGRDSRRQRKEKRVQPAPAPEPEAVYIPEPVFLPAIDAAPKAASQPSPKGSRRIAKRRGAQPGAPSPQSEPELVSPPANVTELPAVDSDQPAGSTGSEVKSSAPAAKSAKAARPAKPARTEKSGKRRAGKGKAQPAPGGDREAGEELVPVPVDDAPVYDEPAADPQPAPVGVKPADGASADGPRPRRWRPFPNAGRAGMPRPGRTEAPAASPESEPLVVPVQPSSAPSGVKPRGQKRAPSATARRGRGGRIAGDDAELKPAGDGVSPAVDGEDLGAQPDGADRTGRAGTGRARSRAERRTAPNGLPVLTPEEVERLAPRAPQAPTELETAPEAAPDPGVG